MRPVRNTWPNTPLADNLKFCAQVLREMLEQRAFESFRVSTMDARTRLSELSDIAKDVEEERIPAVTLEPGIEEIQFNFRMDPIIRKRHQELARLFSLHTKKTPTKQEVSRFRRLLAKGYRDIEQSYRAELDAAIETELSGGADRDTLKSLLNAYMSMLINTGYDRQYIRNQVVDRFFTQNIKRLKQRTLVAFFNRFDGKPRTHAVTVQISKQAGDYLRNLALPVVKVDTYGGLSAHQKAAFSTTSAASASYVTVDDDGHDIYVSLRDVLTALRTLEAMATLSGRSVDFKIPASGYVQRRRKKTGEKIKLTPLVLSRYTTTVTPAVAAEVGGHTKTILRRFDGGSVERVFSSINMAALSKTTQRPENGLIAIWSAIEVLLSDPPSGSPRIVYYVDSLAPCVCATYFRRYINAIFSALNKHERAQLAVGLSHQSIDQSLSNEQKFIQLLFDPAAAAAKAAALTAIASNPLARFRIEKATSNFAMLGDFSNSLQSHESRVRWQLFRIYRTRNNIIHGGRLPSFLSPLVMNVSEYFTSAAEAVIRKAATARSTTSIDQAVSEVGFDYEMMKVRLREGNPAAQIPMKEIRKLFSGR